MAVKHLGNLLMCAVLGLSLQTASIAAETRHFTETIITKQATAGQPAVTERRYCLFDQSLKIADDIVAIINKESGNVMVDMGKGFVSAPVGTMLKEGYRVITLDGSEAEIVFLDCCRTQLKANNLITINADPGCKVAVLDATKAAPVAAAPAGTHPVAYALPVVGAFLVYEVISAATENFGWNED